MTKPLLTLIATLFAANVAFAADKPAEKAAAPAAEKKEEKKMTPQQEKMKKCSAEAKGLKGEEYKKKHSACLKGDAAPAEAAKADAKPTCDAQASEKKLAGAAKSSFVKKCEAEAKK